jgi:hypothetical protein
MSAYIGRLSIFYALFVFICFLCIDKDSPLCGGIIMANNVDYQLNPAVPVNADPILLRQEQSPSISEQAISFQRQFSLIEKNCVYEYGVVITEIEKATECILARNGMHPIRDLVYRYRKLPDSVVRELDPLTVTIMTNLDSFSDKIMIQRLHLKRLNDRAERRISFIQFSIGALIALVIGIVLMIAYI